MDFHEFATSRLKARKYRITTPRAAVLRILSETQKPMNAYELAKQAGGLDVSTTYRILEVLQTLGVTHFIKGKGFVACSDFQCTEADHCHHQFVCQKCDLVKEVHLNDSDFVDTMRKALPGFKLAEHYFEFSGLCKSCNK